MDGGKNGRKTCGTANPEAADGHRPIFHGAGGLPDKEQPGLCGCHGQPERRAEPAEGDSEPGGEDGAECQHRAEAAGTAEQRYPNGRLQHGEQLEGCFRAKPGAGEAGDRPHAATRGCKRSRPSGGCGLLGSGHGRYGYNASAGKHQVHGQRFEKDGLHPGRNQPGPALHEGVQ